MSSPSPLVHGFPHPNDDLWAAQASGQVLKLFVDHRKRWVLYRIPSLLFLFPVVRVLSSALLPGFIGPASSVLPVNLSPFAPCPASGSPSRFCFMKSLAPLGFQCRRVSLGKMHQPPCIPSNFTAIRFTGYQVSPSHDGSTSSPRPYSRFAVRYVHRFCLMLPPDSPFLRMPLPCRRYPSVR